MSDNPAVPALIIRLVANYWEENSIAVYNIGAMMVLTGQRTELTVPGNEIARES